MLQWRNMCQFRAVQFILHHVSWPINRGIILLAMGLSCHYKAGTCNIALVVELGTWELNL